MTQHQPFSEPLTRHETSFRLAPPELGRRVTRLERELRVYRIALISVFAVFAISVLGAAGRQRETPSDIRARRFTVVDGQGRVKAYFGHSGTSTAFQIGSDGDGIRMEHGAHTNAIQLITPARFEAEEEGFQTNSLTLHNDPYNTGLLIINPGTREDGNSRGRAWLSTFKGYELSREMF